MSCDKKMIVRAYVSNGWNENCEVRCGWKNGEYGIYQCEECVKTIMTKKQFTNLTPHPKGNLTPLNWEDNMKIELIKLYDEYLISSKEKRTHEMIDFEKGGKKIVEFKGDFDGFIDYLREKTGWICGKCEQEKNPHLGEEILVGHCRHCPKYESSPPN